MMSRKALETEARRRYILEAARRLLSSKGIENTSMEDIAAAAEYTRRTLYTYFRNRDEIYMLVYLEDMTNRWEQQQADVIAADTGLEKLLAFGRSFYAYSKTYPQSLRLQSFWDYRGIDRDRLGEEIFEAFRSKNEELAAGLREAFYLGMKDGSLRSGLAVDPCISHFVVTLRATINRALFPTYSFAQFDPDEYVNNYLDVFSRGIRNSGVE